MPLERPLKHPSKAEGSNGADLPGWAGSSAGAWKLSVVEPEHTRFGDARSKGRKGLSRDERHGFEEKRNIP